MSEGGPSLQPRNLWAKRESRCLAILERALILLSLELDLPEPEVDLNRRLYFCLLIHVLNYTGELNLALGNYSIADYCFERASTIAAHVFGEKSIVYANCLLYHKKMYSLLGDAQKAASVMEEVVKLYEKTYGKENIKLGMLLHEYVLAKMEAHIDSKSKKDITKELDLVVLHSFEIIKKEFGESSSAYAFALEDAAIYYVLSSRYALALEAIQKAQAIWVKKLGEFNVNTARLVFLSGKIYQTRYWL